MKRRFRLTRSTDIQRVRRCGKSYAHPLVVLYADRAGPPAGDGAAVRVGISAGLAVGNAVQRNRAKRLLRAAMRDLLPQTAPGSDLLLIARPALSRSDYRRTQAALLTLLKRAGLLSPIHDDQASA